MAQMMSSMARNHATADPSLRSPDDRRSEMMVLRPFSNLFTDTTGAEVNSQLSSQRTMNGVVSPLPSVTKCYGHQAVFNSGNQHITVTVLARNFGSHAGKAGQQRQVTIPIFRTAQNVVWFIILTQTDLTIGMQHINSIRKSLFTLKLVCLF